MGDDGGDEERFDLLVDTGRWRELKVSETQTDRQIAHVFYLFIIYLFIYLCFFLLFVSIFCLRNCFVYFCYRYYLLKQLKGVCGVYPVFIIV
jgi:hypothetical protein